MLRLAIAIVRFAETTPINAVVSHAAVSRDKVRLATHSRRDVVDARTPAIPREPQTLPVLSAASVALEDDRSELSEALHMRQHSRYGNAKSRNPCARGAPTPASEEQSSR